MGRVVSVTLGGGLGSRLYPITKFRAKPAAPIGGNLRLIDVPLSNWFNSYIGEDKTMIVLTQARSRTLVDHIEENWMPFVGTSPRIKIKIIPASEEGERFRYEGTADAVERNKDFIMGLRPTLVDILAGDHLTRMNYAEQHELFYSMGADLLIVGRVSPVNSVINKSGVIDVTQGMYAKGFVEKPKSERYAPQIPGKDGYCMESLGIYTFNPDVLATVLEQDRNIPGSSHDFGKDIIPRMIKDGYKVAVMPFEGYWNDVGALHDYFDVNMMLASRTPEFNLYDPNWPFYAAPSRLPVAKINSSYVDSSVGNGSIISDSEVTGSIVGESVHIESSRIDGSILLGRSYISPGAEIGPRVIIDKGNYIPSMRIGRDLDEDEHNGFYVDRKHKLTVVLKDHFAFNYV
ncbi:MAG: sugar phosphate nucleotidyltransferase [Candidatus Woesearchaeota archaeon]|nr:sugar phosphate nucleotidyltransferase [Candidatus Woesearchaeota archaeon]